MAEVVYERLQEQIAGVRKQLNQANTRSERAEYTDGIPAYEFAALPTDGLSDGTTYITLAWVSDGRKTGEGAAAGTGVLAVWQASTATWKRVGDYADVTI